MGARMLRNYLRYPLIDLNEINKRQNQITTCIKKEGFAQWQDLVKG